MIAASGTRFDGLDLLALVLVIVLLFLWGWFSIKEQDRKLQTNIDRVLDGPRQDRKTFLMEIRNSSGFPILHIDSLGHIHANEPLGDTPMPLPYYDWANEKPMPVVNW